VTLHNFIADNGHLFYQSISGDFTAEVKVTGHYATLYDQAGLMLREDEKTWIKCGIEYVEGTQYASAVITRSFSDWSVVPLAANPNSTWFRLVRTGSAVEVYYSLNGSDFTMIRQGYLTETPTLLVGMICASPKGDGFTTTFEDFKLHSPS